jgi:hypothetical protein
MEESYKNYATNYDTLFLYQWLVLGDTKPIRAINTRRHCIAVYRCIHLTCRSKAAVSMSHTIERTSQTVKPRVNIVYAYVPWIIDHIQRGEYQLSLRYIDKEVCSFDYR